jgi:alkylated DNA repair dioxygenase AlkB
MTEPFTYEADFLSPEEIADLEKACESAPWHRYKIRGHYVRRSSCLYTKVRTSRSLLTHHGGDGIYSLDEAPEAIKAYRAKLSAHAGVDINYMSCVRYLDGQEYMGPHQHKEDRERDDQRVWIMSLQTPRPFVTEPKDGGCEDDRKVIIAEPGSLITLSTAANTTHLHSVPEDKSVKTVRYSINCKAIPPQVWCCRAGKSYPKDAIYVGRDTSDRQGNLLRECTPFGNYCHLGPEAYREMVLAMIAADPEFAAQVKALRGKDFLCWCSGKEKDNCHARVLLELANRV